MRKEAEADQARREQAFARLEALKPAPREEVRIGPAGIPLFRVLDEQDQEDEQDENAPAERRFVVAEETFDRWLFGSTGDAESGRAYLEALLQRKLNDVNLVRELTPAQRKKLVLAGRGDIKRLFDRIEEERKEFHRRQDRLRPMRTILAGASTPARDHSPGAFRVWIDLRQDPQEDARRGPARQARGEMTLC